MSDNPQNSDHIRMDAERLRHLPILRRFLRKMPKQVAHSFNWEQLHYIRKTLENSPKHKRFEHNIVIPFLSNSFFIRIIAGINRRKIERKPSKIANIVGTIIFYSIAITVLLVTLYLIKCILGFDIFTEFSMGII